jgi:hypothetical protein
MQGFGGPKLSNNDFEKVNEKRQGQCYWGAEAARNIQGLSRKKALTKSPIVRMIDYGATKDGYWNASHMLVQVEDCMDVWNCLTGRVIFFPCRSLITCPVAIVREKTGPLLAPPI